MCVHFTIKVTPLVGEHLNDVHKMYTSNFMHFMHGRRSLGDGGTGGQGGGTRPPNIVDGPMLKPLNNYCWLCAFSSVPPNLDEKSPPLVSCIPSTIARQLLKVIGWSESFRMKILFLSYSRTVQSPSAVWWNTSVHYRNNNMYANSPQFEVVPDCTTAIYYFKKLSQF